MGWVLIILAALSEIIGVVGLRFYSQYKTLRNLMLYIGGFGVSFALLYTSFNYLQLSIAYVVQDIINAICLSQAYYQNIRPEDVLVELTYEDDAGFESIFTVYCCKSNTFVFLCF